MHNNTDKPVVYIRNPVIFYGREGEVALMGETEGHYSPLVTEGSLAITSRIVKAKAPYVETRNTRYRMLGVSRARENDMFRIINEKLEAMDD